MVVSYFKRKEIERLLHEVTINLRKQLVNQQLTMKLCEIHIELLKARKFNTFGITMIGIHGVNS